MFARIGAKALFLVAAAAMIFFGVGLLGMALALALTDMLGATGAYAVAGGVLLLLALAVFGLTALLRPRRPPPPAPGAFLSMLMGALARDLPWATVVSAGLAGIAELLVRRQRSRSRD